MDEKSTSTQAPAKTKDPLAGKSNAFKAALEAVERMGNVTAERPAAKKKTGGKGRRAHAGRGRGVREP